MPLTRCSILPFFFYYELKWLILLLKYHNRMKAYRHIRFEQEAYMHQDDFTYLKTRKHYQFMRGEIAAAKG